MRKTFVLSDESLNSNGYRVLTGGLSLKRFRANPVMLYNHNRYGTQHTGPIGKWENIRTENGQLLADPVFDMEDPIGAAIARKVENGFIRGASLGFEPISTSTDPKYLVQGQQRPTVTKGLVLEASIVDFPANENSLGLALYDKNGKLIDEAKEDELLKLGLGLHETKKEETDMLKYSVALLAMLALSADATDAQVESAAKALREENTTLRAELEQLKADFQKRQEALALELVENAVKANRIQAGQKENYLKLAKADYAATASAIESMTPTHKLSAVPNSSPKTGGEDRQTWGYDDWAGKDPKGLQTLKANEPERFEEMLLAKKNKVRESHQIGA